MRRNSFGRDVFRLLAPDFLSLTIGIVVYFVGVLMLRVPSCRSVTVGVGDLLSAKPDAARLGRSLGFLGAAADHRALLLGHRRVDVQHEWVDVRPAQR